MMQIGLIITHTKDKWNVMVVHWNFTPAYDSIFNLKVFFKG